MPERKIVYETLEHKADSGFLVRAPSWQRLYIDASLALTDMMVKLDAIETRIQFKVEVSADDREALMVRWLSEILFLFEKHRFLAKRVVFDRFDGKKIAATLSGETYEPVRHGSVSEIKAVTYHQLKLGDEERPEPHCYARIFLDL